MSIEGEYYRSEERSRADLIRGIDRAIYTADQHFVKGMVQFGINTPQHISMGIEASTAFKNPQNEGEVKFTIQTGRRSRFSATLAIEQEAIHQSVRDVMDGMIPAIPLNGIDLRRLPDFRTLMRPGVDQTQEADNILRWLLGGLHKSGGALRVTGQHTNVDVQGAAYSFINFDRNYFPNSNGGKTPTNETQARSTVAAELVPRLFVPANPEVNIGVDKSDGMEQTEALSRLWSFVDAVK